MGTATVMACHCVVGSTNDVPPFIFTQAYRVALTSPLDHDVAVNVSQHEGYCGHVSLSPA